MEELHRASYDLSNEQHVTAKASNNVNARYDVLGGSREQKARHQKAYRAAYEAGEYTTHASFAEANAGKPGFNVSKRVLESHLNGEQSSRKK
jgi:hypothetical protein